MNSDYVDVDSIVSNIEAKEKDIKQSEKCWYCGALIPDRKAREPRLCEYCREIVKDAKCHLTNFKYIEKNFTDVHILAQEF
jgi:hypothetical protein